MVERIEFGLDTDEVGKVEIIVGARGLNPRGRKGVTDNNGLRSNKVAA